MVVEATQDPRRVGGPGHAASAWDGAACPVGGAGCDSRPRPRSADERTLEDQTATDRAGAPSPPERYRQIVAERGVCLPRRIRVSTTTLVLDRIRLGHRNHMAAPDVNASPCVRTTDQVGLDRSLLQCLDAHPVRRWKVVDNRAPCPTLAPPPADPLRRGTASLELLLPPSGRGRRGVLRRAGPGRRRDRRLGGSIDGRECWQRVVDDRRRDRSRSPSVTFSVSLLIMQQARTSSRPA